MCRALRDEGVDVLLATTDAQLEKSAELKLRATSDGVPTILFPSQIGSSFKYSLPFAKWLDGHVSDYDLVHIHSVFNHSSISAARSCRKREVPYIVRPLGTLDPWGMSQKSFRKKLFWFGGLKQLLSGAAAIHYTSEPEQRAVEETLGLKHGAVIHLGVEDGESSGSGDRQLLRSEFPTLRTHPFVLFMSRLHPKKGLENLLKAFLALVDQEEFSDWRLMVAGDGSPEYARTLKQLTSSNAAEEQILFTGWLDGGMKEAVLREASLLALPSHQENFGLCVMEALARGVPVLISPQVNLAPQIENAGAGWVSELDGAQLKSTLAEALRSKQERTARGMAGQTLAKAFAWPIIARQLSALYASVQSNRAG